MNPVDDSGKSSNDKDIASLFSEQTVSVPEHLDTEILALSKEALKEPQNTQKFWTSHNPWMAMAAMLMLTVFIVPLMLNEPESQFDGEVKSEAAPASSAMRGISSNEEDATLIAAPTVKKALKSVREYLNNIRCVNAVLKHIGNVVEKIGKKPPTDFC